MPTEVSLFNQGHRAGLSKKKMFQLLESNLRKTRQGGTTYNNHHPFTSHIEHPPGTFTHMSVIPSQGVCAGTLPAMTGQPATPWSVLPWHTWAPYPFNVIFRSSSKPKTESLAPAPQSWESSPTTSPWQPQLQKSQSTSYANEERPQMSAVTQPPSFLPTEFPS